MTPFRDFGAKLFEAAFPPDIRRLFHQTKRTVARGKLRWCFRIRLGILPPEIARLPWELLYHPTRHQYLGPLSQFANRSLHFGRSSRRPAADRTARADSGAGTQIPPGLTTLKVDEEKRRVEEALKELRSNGQVQLEWLKRGTWRELHDTLNRSTWHALHFIGHGGFDAVHNEGRLVLEGDEGADSYNLSASSLADLLASHPFVRFVFLNSCEGARGRPAPTCFPAPRRLSYNVAFPQSWRCKTRSATLPRSSSPVSFCLARRSRRLTWRLPTRQAVKLSLPNSCEWATSCLFTHAGDGVLFTRRLVSAAVLSTSLTGRRTLRPKRLNPRGPADVGPRTSSGRARATSRAPDALLGRT